MTGGFACDMYGKAVLGDRERVLACLKGLVADRAKIARRVQPGVDVLVSQPLANGQVAAIGYCFGGRAVLELARAGAQLAGAISVHGTLRDSRSRSADQRPDHRHPPLELGDNRVFVSVVEIDERTQLLDRVRHGDSRADAGPPGQTISRREGLTVIHPGDTPRDP